MSDTTLDGIYQVTSVSSYAGPIEKRSDGQTEIRNGQTWRYDEANVLWTSTFRVIDENQVEMTSHADPSKADLDHLLIGENGLPTSQPVTYTATLKLARKGDKLQMSGQIQFGPEIVMLTLRKIGELEE